MEFSLRRSNPRKALALAVACALGSAAPSVALAVASRTALPHSGAAAVRSEIRSLMPRSPKAPSSPAAVFHVTSCADDDGPGTLRTIVAAAGEGDSVDMSTLSCSSITLTQGAVPVLLNDLTVSGPGAEALALDGDGASRVFVHPGYGTLVVQGLTLRNGATRVAGNKITGGGCVASLGYVALDHSSVSGCYASGEGVYGGGIFAYGVLLYDSSVSGNVALGKSATFDTASFGGGIYARYARIADSTVSANRATHTFAYGKSGYDTGGGIFCDGGGTILASTIEGNYSYRFGGGVSTYGRGVVDVINSTISGNSANTKTGGGIHMRVYGTANIENSTITANHAAIGGGVYLRGLTQAFTLQSTVISGNTAASGGADIGASAPTVLLGANNLVVANGANVTLPADTLHVDPLLRPLAFNGGATRTHALRPGSPALDAGNDFAGLATDQRGDGFPRTVGAGTDIGAFEGVVATAAGPAQIPTLSNTVLAVLAAVLAAAGGLAMRRHRRHVT